MSHDPTSGEMSFAGLVASGSNPGFELGAGVLPDAIKLALSGGLKPQTRLWLHSSVIQTVREGQGWGWAEG